MSDEALKPETHVPSSSTTWGERFLAQYRRAAKGYAWNYETIQAIKRMDRDEFLALMRRGGGFRYQDFEKARELSPERFADWAAGDWESAASGLPPGEGSWGARFVARHRWITGESFWNAETTKEVEGLELEEFLTLMRRRGALQYEDFQAARRSTPEAFAVRLAKAEQEALAMAMVACLGTVVLSF